MCKNTIFSSSSNCGLQWLILAQSPGIIYTKQNLRHLFGAQNRILNPELRINQTKICYFLRIIIIEGILRHRSWDWTNNLFRAQLNFYTANPAKNYWTNTNGIFKNSTGSPVKTNWRPHSCQINSFFLV